MTCLFQIPSGTLIAIPQIILALIVTLAFFVIGETKEDLIDREIVIKKIMLAQMLFPLVVIGSLSLIFVECNCGLLKILPFVYDICLIALASDILYRFFHWISLESETNNTLNYRQQMRMQFYSNQKSDQDYLRVWNTVLSDKSLKHKNQVGLVDAFISTVKKIKNQDEFSNNCDQLIWQFTRNLDKINFYTPKDYKKLVELSLEFFKENHGTNTEQKSYNLVNDKQMLFSALLSEAIETASTNYGVLERTLFDVVNKAIHDEESDHDEIIWVLIHGIVYKCLEGQIRFSEVWGRNKIFKQWEISSNGEKNLSEGQNYILMIYKDIVFNRLCIPDVTNEEATLIDDVTQCIFPEIDSRTWLTMCSFFLMLPCEDKNNTSQIKEWVDEWCNTNRKYGLLERMRGGFSLSQDNKNEEEFKKEIFGRLERIREMEQKETFKILLALGILPKAEKEDLVSQTLSIVKKLSSSNKTTHDEKYNCSLVKLKKTLEALREFMQNSNNT